MKRPSRWFKAFLECLPPARSSLMNSPPMAAPRNPGGLNANEMAAKIPTRSMRRGGRPHHSFAEAQAEVLRETRGNPQMNRD